MLVGEEDENTRVVLEELLQPTKQAQVVVPGFLRRTTKSCQGVQEDFLIWIPKMRSSTTVYSALPHALFQKSNAYICIHRRVTGKVSRATFPPLFDRIVPEEKSNSI